MEVNALQFLDLGIQWSECEIAGNENRMEEREEEREEENGKKTERKRKNQLSKDKGLKQKGELK